MSEPSATDPTSAESPRVSPTIQSTAADRAPLVDSSVVDLDAIERDLNAVEIALSRLADDTYWTDEVTGEPIPDDVLTADPTARRI